MKKYQDATFTKETYFRGIIVTLRESINNEALTIFSYNHSQDMSVGR